MARENGVFGFEMGDMSGLDGIGASAANIINSASSARTGAYRYNSKVTTAALNHALVFTVGTAVAGEPVNAFLRFYFRPTVRPGLDDLVIARLGGLSGIRLDMNTLGALRFVGFDTTTSYQGSTVTNKWYRVDMRIFGLERASGVDNSTRARGSISVFDVGVSGLDIPAQVVYFVTDDYTPSTSLKLAGDTNTNCALNKPMSRCVLNLFPQSQGFVTISLRVTGYFVRVFIEAEGGTVNFNGDYAPLTESVCELFQCNTGTPTGVGTFKEHGTITGFSAASGILYNYRVNNTAFGVVTADIGQRAEGVSTTREIDYDDIYYDFGTGTTDANLVGFPQLIDFPSVSALGGPHGTRVYGFTAVEQGAFNQFTPSGSYTSVSEIPLVVAGNAVSSSVGGSTTTYIHVGLADITERVYHIRCWLNGVDNASNTHAILIDGTEYAKSFTSLTGSGDLQTRSADKSYASTPLTNAQFVAIEFGGKNTTIGGTFSIRNIALEVLGGRQAFIETLPASAFTVTPTNSSNDARLGLSPDLSAALSTTPTDSSGGALVDFVDNLSAGTTPALLAVEGAGVVLTVPSAKGNQGYWSLHRLDIGPREEDTA